MNSKELLELKAKIKEKIELEFCDCGYKSDKCICNQIIDKSFELMLGLLREKLVALKEKYELSLVKIPPLGKEGRELWLTGMHCRLEVIKEIQSWVGGFEKPKKEVEEK